MARKFFKYLGIAALVLIGVVLIIAAFIWVSLEWNRYSKEKERIKYQKEFCDTIKTVDGNFEFTLLGFNHKEAKEVHFYLIRNKLIIKDSTIKVAIEANSETQKVLLPFKNFKVTDIVLAKIGKQYYEMSDINYIAFYNYGMFGPVGPCHCGQSGFKKLNGKDAGSGWLIKKYGLLNNQLPPRN